MWYDGHIGQTTTTENCPTNTKLNLFTMSEKDYRLNQEVYPYTKFPNFLFDLDLKANELALVLALIKYQSCETVTVGHKKLSELSGTHVNTVKNTLLSLKEKKIIDWKARYNDDGTQKTNQYFFNAQMFQNYFSYSLLTPLTGFPSSGNLTAVHDGAKSRQGGAESNIGPHKRCRGTLQEMSGDPPTDVYYKEKALKEKELKEKELKEKENAADKTLVHSDRPPSVTVTEEIDNINTNKKKLEELDHRSQRPTPRSVTENDKKNTNNSSTEKKTFSKSGIRLLSSIPELEGILKTAKEFIVNGMQKNGYYKKWKPDKQVKKINAQIDILEEAAKQIKNEKLLEKFLLNYLEGLKNGEENYATVPLHMIVHGCEKLASDQKRNQSNGSFSNSNPAPPPDMDNNPLMNAFKAYEARQKAKQEQNTEVTF